jgi:hypothetical protein
MMLEGEPSANQAHLLNAALAGEAIVPLYADAARVAGALRNGEAKQSWTPSEAARRTDLAPMRAAAALRVLRGMGVLEEEEFAMNFSAEPLYRVSDGPQIPRG